jgi:hypothetical protein
LLEVGTQWKPKGYSDGSDSWADTNELPEQLRYISQYSSIIGSSFFTYNTLLSTDKEVLEFMDRLNNYYWTEYATFPWASTVEKQEDPVCPIGEEYIDGECTSICPIGEEYIDGECTSICPIGEEYTDGECTSICPIGEEYTDGECTSICSIGEDYTDGECTSICSIGEEYTDGECTSVCSVGEEYIDGECTSICPIGEEYTDGECTSICSIEEEYVEGECVLIEVENTGCFLFNMVSFSSLGSVALIGFYITKKWIMKI